MFSFRLWLGLCSVRLGIIQEGFGGNNNNNNNNNNNKGFTHRQVCQPTLLLGGLACTTVNNKILYIK